MTRSTICLKMPFRKGIVIYEKEVPFLFKIMTLELIAEYLGVGLDRLFDDENLKSDKMPLAMIWCAYLAACKDNYQKPQYKIEDAEKWSLYMSTKSREAITKEIGILFDSLTKFSAKKDGAGSEKK